MAVIRLDKYLADAGIGTRSAVKNIVKQGRVTINKDIVKKSEVKVDTECDEVNLDGKLLSYNEYEFFMLNKPKGVVSATADEHDKTVVELITEAKRRDIFPVGRLDKDTEGLLILTNDGKLANNLLAPGKHVDKRYFARIAGEVNEDTIKAFEKGIDIGDEKLTRPAVLSVKHIFNNEDIYTDGSENNINNYVDEGVYNKGTVSEIEITITEGRFHQIKRMFEAVGMKVIYLKRLSMGKLYLDDNLKPGEYRRLTDEEVQLLKL